MASFQLTLKFTCGHKTNVTGLQAYQIVEAVLDPSKSNQLQMDGHNAVKVNSECPICYANSVAGKSADLSLV